jgi:hypothetical protein
MYQGVDKASPFCLERRKEHTRVLVATCVLLGVGDACLLLVD